MDTIKEKTLIDTFYKEIPERICEVTYIFNTLDKLVKKSNKPIKILDVGFAGSWYITELIDRYGDNIEYTGLDGDKGRILGDALKTNDTLKDKWRSILNNIKYVHGDIIKYKTNDKYDVIMSISTIEHIVPLGYQNDSPFNLHLDINAIDNMKKMLNDDGKLLLTFPCGKEKLFYNPTNKNAKMLDSNGFTKSRHNIVIYDENRINKIIGNYEVIDKDYWVLDGDRFVMSDEAIKYNHETSVVDAVCCLLIKKI